MHKALYLIALAALTGFITFQMIHKAPPQISPDYANLFVAWKQKHGRLYATPSEQTYRLGVFKAQVDYVEAANLQYRKYMEAKGESMSEDMFGINFSSDLTTEEFEMMYAGGRKPEYIEESEVPEDNMVSTLLQNNKLRQGYDVRVRNQGSCGSCWCFSGVANFEKFYFDKTSRRLDFSQQYILDCETSSYGCNGGFTFRGIALIRDRGINLATAYPYAGRVIGCQNKADKYKIPMTVTQVRFDSERASSFVNQGKHISGQLYCSGQFRNLRGNKVYEASSSGECSKTTNHEINLIASNNDGSFKVLNSWGAGWGDKGAMWIKPCSRYNLMGANDWITWIQ